LPCRLHREHAAAARLVLDQHLLAEHLAEQLAVETRRRVGAAAGVERHVDAQRPRWEGGRLPLRQREIAGSEQQRGGDAQPSAHLDSFPFAVPVASNGGGGTLTMTPSAFIAAICAPS